MHYENGVPKIECSIPVAIIDKVPQKNFSTGETKVLKKEVLEMRTSNSVNISNNNNEDNNHKKKNLTSPNEDNKKLAIWSIYKKRPPTSSDLDKVKREIKTEEPQHTHQHSVKT